MKYLLDTNICIYIINKRPSTVIEQIRTKPVDDVAISTITIAELDYGVERSQRAVQNRIALLQFLIPFRILDFDQQAAVIYGKVRRQLEIQGTPIGPMDLLLAAQAIAYHLVLVTNNEKEFKRVENLAVENWA